MTPPHVHQEVDVNMFQVLGSMLLGGVCGSLPGPFLLWLLKPSANAAACAVKGSPVQREWEASMRFYLLFSFCMVTVSAVLGAGVTTIACLMNQCSLISVLQTTGGFAVCQSVFAILVRYTLLSW